MANKISLVFEAIGADKLAQVFGQVSGAAEKAGASAEKASQGTQAAGQAAGTATKNVDLLGLSLNKMSGLAGQAGVDLGVFRQALSGAHESMSMLAGGFSAGTAAAGAFVVGVAGITGALVATSQHLVSSYNEIKTFAAVSGMAAGDADDLADAMQAVGVSSQQLSMALFKLEDDAAAGGEALLKLGISMDDLKTKASGELFVMAIDKIQALGSQSEKTAALVELFGARLGRAFAELVREGGMSIDQLKAKVADLSPWTKEMENNARNLAVAQTFLSNAIGGVVDMLGNAFAPILTTTINTMTTWVVELRKGVESSGVLGTAINMLVDVFVALWEALSPLMPLLKELGLAAVQMGLAMMAAFQGVMIPVVALTGAIGALWAAIQKAVSGDFEGALTALKTGLAETEAAVGRQITRFNEQVLANEKLSDSLNGVSTSWDDLTSYTTQAGAAVDKVAPSLRTVGDAAKESANALAQWEKAVGQVGLTAAIISDNVEKLRSSMEFDDLDASIRGLDAFHTSLTNLQRGIDALHMNEAEKELAGFRAELDKIPGLGDAAKAALLNAAEGIIEVRDAAKEGVKELQDAAKYMTSLGTAATAAKAPLENLGQYVGDLQPAAASAAEAMAILTDRIERLMPVNSIESITQYGDAIRQAGVSAADSAVTFDILNDSLSEAGAASLESEQRWTEFGESLQGAFLSVTDTFTKMATGLIQGTLTVGDAFKNLGQSLVTNFAQMVMHEVFDPILEEAASFVGQLIQTLLSADWGSVAASWGQAIAGIFSSVFGGGGGASIGGGGDWWVDFGFEALAHGGTITRTGPFILHQGETVVPASARGGSSSGFSGYSGRSGGTVPVYVQNFDEGGDAFSAAFDYGKLVTKIGTKAYDFAAPYFDMPTTTQFAKMVGKEVISYVGNLFGAGGAAAAGAGQSMGLAGAEAAAAFGAAFETGGFAGGAGTGAIGSGVAGGGTWLVGASGAAMAPGLIGGGAVLAIPAIASFLATMGMEEQTRQDIVRRESGQVYGGDMAARAGTVQTMADLDKKYQDKIFGERTPRQDLTMLATWAMVGAEQANQSIITMKQYAQDMGANVDDLTAMEQANMDRMNAFVSKAAEVGVTPDMALLNVAPHTVSPGHGVQSPENIGALMDVWTEIINRITSGTQAIADGSQDAAEASEQQSTATRTVVQNQADLIIKYGNTVETLRQMSEQLDLGVNIPDIMKLTTEELAFLGTATGAQIEEMIQGWKGAITEAIVKDPVKLTSILPIENFQREGESVEQAGQRVAESLHALGAMMTSVNQEAIALTQTGLAGATMGFQTSIADISKGVDEAAKTFQENAIRIDESGKLIGDPTAQVEAAIRAHDLLVARYEAELALIAQINASVGQLGQTAVALTQMGPFLQAIGVNIGPAIEAFTGFGTTPRDREFDATTLVGALPTAEAALTHFGASVEAFGNLAQTAGKTADPALIQSSINVFSNLMAQIPNAMAQIMAIQDPGQRMAALSALMQQLGTAAQAAAAGLLALVDHINQLVAGAAAAAGTLAKHAPIFKAVGVDLVGTAEDLAKFSMEVPTMAGKLTAFGAAIDLGIAAMQTGQAPDPKVFVDAAVSAVQAAMQITDPAERQAALSGIMDQIAKVLATLPPDMQKAIIASFGPEFKFIGDAIIDAGKQQAAAAIKAGDQLKAIIGPSGALNPQNFIAMMVGGINTSLQAIVGGVGPAFDLIVNGMQSAGTIIAQAIVTAGEALSNALNGFKSPAEQLADALRTLGSTIGNTIRTAVEAGMRNAFRDMPGAQSGLDAVPKTGAYILHEGEGVLTKAENQALHRGSLQILGSYQEGTVHPYPTAVPPPKPESYGPEWQAYMAAQNAKIEADRRAANAAAMAASGADSMTDAVDNLTGSILNAADALINSADLTGANLQGVAYALAGWSLSLTTVEDKAATFTAGMRAWAVQIARTNDVMTELVGGGRLAFEVIQSMVVAAKAMSDADPGAKLDTLTTAYNAIVQGAEAAQDAVRTSYDRQRDAIENNVDAIDDQARALDDQIRHLEDLRQATEAWGSVAESVADMLLDLRLSDLAPPNAMGQLNLAQSELATAMAAFRAAPTPEGAGRVQDLARSVLDAASQVFTRPSPEYQALFTSITTGLEEIQGIAESQGGSQEDLLQEIATLESRREQLDIERNHLEEQTRTAIEQLNAQEQAALAAIQATVGPSLQALAGEMERVAVIAAQQGATIATGQSGIHGVLDASYRVLTSMDGSTQVVVDSLGMIVGILGGGRLIPNQDPSRYAVSDVPPEAQEGAWRTHAGPYTLHADEMVLPADIATAVRAGGGGGGAPA